VVPVMDTSAPLLKTIGQGARVGRLRDGDSRRSHIGASNPRVEFSTFGTGGGLEGRTEGIDNPAVHIVDHHYWWRCRRCGRRGRSLGAVAKIPTPAGVTNRPAIPLWNFPNFPHLFHSISILALPLDASHEG
jgi:hypothetical protein